MIGKVSHIANFIKNHGITPSPRERFNGMRDTILGWGITAFTFTFFETPLDPYIATLSFLIKFISGGLAIVLYVLFESFCRGDKLKGLNTLLIRDYNETATHDIHLSAKQRKKFIYLRCLISAGSYIALNVAKDLFGDIDNAEIMGADPLVYAILASYIFLQKIYWKEKIGIIIAALGVVFIMYFDFSGVGWNFGLISGISGIFSALLFSIMFFVSSIIVRHDTPIRITYYHAIVGSVLASIVLLIMVIFKLINAGSFPSFSLSLLRDSVVVGILYAISIVLFLRAFLYTEPVIIAMLGYTLGFFTFSFEWLFKGVTGSYKNLVGSGLITIGCTILIYGEYVRSMFEYKKWKNFKPVYRSNLRHDLLTLEESFHEGKLSKYEYLGEKHEFNKVLLEYTRLINSSIIDRIEILENTLLFTFKPLNIQIEADGGARSAPFEILNFGSYEPEDEEVAYSLINDGDIIIDAGAHIGWYSLNFAKRFPSSKIYSFEPIKSTFEVLERNIKRNKFSNIFALNYGFSSKEEEKELYYFKGGSAIASIENLISHGNAEKIKCLFKTLDDVVEELNMSSVDFIKCDIEGAELFFLQGAEKTIKKFKPIILIEIYEDWCKKCGYTSRDIIDILFSMNYQIHRAENGCLSKVETFDFVNNERYNYFFLNKERHASLIKKCT